MSMYIAKFMYKKKMTYNLELKVYAILYVN